MRVKRWTLCLMRGHRWARTPYPEAEGEQTAYFLRCMSCKYENHNAGMGVRPTGAGL
jgi:hypothetical protein